MVLGIDLGSSNTVIATVSRDGTPVIIPDMNNKKEESTPSMVMLENNKAFVGTIAKDIFELYPDKELLRFFKRKFGTHLPVCFTAENKPIFSETIAAMVLKKAVFDARLFLNEPISKIVITIPSHFNDAQRRSVIEAAKLADIELTTILDEPIAAAIFYCRLQTNIEDELIMVYDLGGGTFDLTILTNSQGKIHVIAKGGISDLGGKEFDEIVQKKINDTYFQLFKRTIENSRLNENRLKSISEQIKIRLNETRSGGFAQWIYIGNQFFKVFFDKDEYQLLAEELISKTETAVNRSLRSLGLNLGDIHRIILIGGASSSHLVYDHWNDKIDSTKQMLIYHQPLASVAKGAAIYANSLSDTASGFESTIDLMNVSTYNIALRQTNNSQPEIVINKNLPLPVSGSKIIRISPSSPPQNLRFQLVQFFDQQNDIQELGEISITDFPVKATDLLIEIIVQNKENGTIGLKLVDAETKRNLKFEFIRNTHKHEYNFDEQYQHINSFYINTIY